MTSLFPTGSTYQIYDRWYFLGILREYLIGLYLVVPDLFVNVFVPSPLNRVRLSWGEIKEHYEILTWSYSRGVDLSLRHCFFGHCLYRPNPLGALNPHLHIGSKTLSTLIWNCQIVFVSMLIVVSFMKCVLPVLFVTTDFSRKISFGNRITGEFPGEELRKDLKRVGKQQYFRKDHQQVGKQQNLRKDRNEWGNGGHDTRGKTTNKWGNKGISGRSQEIPQWVGKWRDGNHQRIGWSSSRKRSFREISGGWC